MTAGRIDAMRILSILHQTRRPKLYASPTIGDTRYVNGNIARTNGTRVNFLSENELAREGEGRIKGVVNTEEA